MEIFELICFWKFTEKVFSDMLQSFVLIHSFLTYICFITGTICKLYSALNYTENIYLRGFNEQYKSMFSNSEKVFIRRSVWLKINLISLFSYYIQRKIVIIMRFSCKVPIIKNISGQLFLLIINLKFR